MYMVPHESWSTCSHVTNITKIYQACDTEINNFLYIWNISHSDEQTTATLTPTRPATYKTTEFTFSLTLLIAMHITFQC
jgi:hypothetical protein